HQHFAAAQPGCYRLVGALAPETEVEVGAENGFPGARERIREGDEIGVGAAYDRNSRCARHAYSPARICKCPGRARATDVSPNRADRHEVGASHYQRRLLAMLDQCLDCFCRQDAIESNVDFPRDLYLVGCGVYEPVTSLTCALEILWSREQANAGVAHSQSVF